MGTEFIKEARKIVCAASGEFVCVDLETAHKWLNEAKERGIEPSVREDGDKKVSLYVLDEERSVVTHTIDAL